MLDQASLSTAWMASFVKSRCSGVTASACRRSRLITPGSLRILISTSSPCLGSGGARTRCQTGSALPCCSLSAYHLQTRSRTYLHDMRQASPFEGRFARSGSGWWRASSMAGVSVRASRSPTAANGAASMRVARSFAVIWRSSAASCRFLRQILRIWPPCDAPGPSGFIGSSVRRSGATLGQVMATFMKAAAMSLAGRRWVKRNSFRGGKHADFRA
mmetsp:Transcript_75847/g.214622  ORF Transcript_75847/g.214622 Transcript_75847/m.214622 type:complete len:216 (+) Transcript_75847:1329-1976(+)